MQYHATFILRHFEKEKKTINLISHLARGVFRTQEPRADESFPLIGSENSHFVFGPMGSGESIQSRSQELWNWSEGTSKRETYSEERLIELEKE